MGLCLFPPFIPSAIEYMRDAVERHKICGDGRYTKLCNSWIEEQFGCRKALLTTSGSAALDMAALLCDVKPGDEVILIGREGMRSNFGFRIGYQPMKR